MKTLLLMRHAKAEDKEPNMCDHDRPLSSSGENAAILMGKWLKKCGISPDLIICSSALRTKTTAQLIADNLNYKNQILISNELYLTGYLSYLNQIQKVKNDIKTLLLIAHNPTLEDLLSHLTNEYLSFEPASAANINISINSWKKINKNTTGELVNLWSADKIKFAG